MDRRDALISARVSVASIAGNTALTAFKLFAGITAHSDAMISDAVHSASDVLSSFIVLIGIKLSAKEADPEHPYGHERFECVSALILSFLLLATGLMIGESALKKIVDANRSAAETVPGMLAAVAALVSIFTKEGMYWFTRAYARRLDSPSLMAEAWHQRSDALSSVGALIGIAGGRLGFPVLDAVASLVICVFILKAAADIFHDAVSKLVDHSCDSKLETAIRACAAKQDQVLGVDSLNTREFGNRIYVDIEIRANGNLSLWDSHAIAERVHDAVESEFPKVKHVMVHINPDHAAE